jgi:hypothetical protein
VYVVGTKVAVSVTFLPLGPTTVEVLTTWPETVLLVDGCVRSRRPRIGGMKDVEGCVNRSILKIVEGSKERARD